MTGPAAESHRPERPPQYTELEWSALLAGGTLRRGRFHPDDETVYEIRWPSGRVTDLRGGANPLSAASVFDAEAFRRLLAESVVDPTVEVMRLRYAPFQGAYDAAFADWEKLMDAPGLPDPMGAYAVLNIHYPQILERLGCVGCIHCDVAWPCTPFVTLNESWRPE